MNTDRISVICLSVILNILNSYSLTKNTKMQKHDMKWITKRQLVDSRRAKIRR